MSTRFNSFKNKPNSQLLTPKRRVLKEFQMLQKQLHNINAKDPNEKIDWNDTKVMSANGYQKTGTYSTQNATDTLGR